MDRNCRPYFLFRALLVLSFSITGFLSTSAQTDSSYYILLAKANLYHLQGDHANAVPLYEAAFENQQPDAQALYKAAGVYALAGNANKSFHYLHQAMSSGWTESNRMILDPYFDFLRTQHPIEWAAIEKRAIDVDNEFGNRLTLPALRVNINLMSAYDQMQRYERSHAKTDSARQILSRRIEELDRGNALRAKKIIQEFGWPRQSQIGADGQNNLWLIVQHADHDILFQRDALQAMERLMGTQEINLEHYAFLYDRVQCNLNYKQRYGTQVTWSENGRASSFRRVVDEHEVNQRRKNLGLLPMEVYALTYGFDYTPLNAEQSYRRDSLVTHHIESLIDSGNYFFQKKLYQKTYDFYNTASTFLGGMDDGANLDAARIFAKIALRTKEEKYKSISLDFLELGYLRGKLNKKILRDKQLKRLSDHPRMKALVEKLGAISN